MGEDLKAPASRPCSTDRAGCGLWEGQPWERFSTWEDAAHSLTRHAAYDVQVAAYRESVLTGFQQVEDNLAAVRILENEAKVQDEAVAAAQSSLDLSITRYKGGVTSYLEVTIAQSAALADEVTAVNLLGRRMANTVLLIQALGGGWDRSSLPARPECCGKLVSSAGSSGVNSGAPR